MQAMPNTAAAIIHHFMVPLLFASAYWPAQNKKTIKRNTAATSAAGSHQSM